MTQPALFDYEEDWGGEFSPCRNYRYALTRDWGAESKSDWVAFCCLNPSTADEVRNDNTVTRCINYARSWGYRGFVMLNAYGFRATDPRNMRAGRRFDDSPVITDDPVGEGNDEALSRYAKKVDRVVCGWGNHCTDERERQVVEALGVPLFCLKQTKKGKPWHPLYFTANAQPTPFFLADLTKNARDCSTHTCDNQRFVPCGKRSV